MTGSKPHPIEPRLLSRRVITEAGCWHYTRFITRQGYGAIGYQGRRNVLVHRVAYELFVGPIPEGLTLDHRCHTDDETCPGGSTCLHRRCFNPEHLEPVTHAVNTQRGRQATKTHCKRGHELHVDNLFPWGIRKGVRACRTCGIEKARNQHRRAA